MGICLEDYEACGRDLRTLVGWLKSRFALHGCRTDTKEFSVVIGKDIVNRSATEI